VSDLVVYLAQTGQSGSDRHVQSALN